MTIFSNLVEDIGDGVESLGQDGAAGETMMKGPEWIEHDILAVCCSLPANVFLPASSDNVDPDFCHEDEDV